MMKMYLFVKIFHHFELKKCAYGRFSCALAWKQVPGVQRGNVFVCLGHESSAPAAVNILHVHGCVRGKGYFGVCTHAVRQNSPLSSHSPSLSLVGKKPLIRVSKHYIKETFFTCARRQRRMEAAPRPSPCLSLSLAHPLSFTVFNSANAPSVLFRSQTISRCLYFCHLEGRIQLH